MKGEQNFRPLETSKVTHYFSGGVQIRVIMSGTAKSESLNETRIGAKFQIRRGKAEATHRKIPRLVRGNYRKTR